MTTNGSSCARRPTTAAANAKLASEQINVHSRSFVRSLARAQQFAAKTAAPLHISSARELRLNPFVHAASPHDNDVHETCAPKATEGDAGGGNACDSQPDRPFL